MTEFDNLNSKHVLVKITVHQYSRIHLKGDRNNNKKEQHV